jgi:hypothetical protein
MAAATCLSIAAQAGVITAQPSMATGFPMTCRFGPYAVEWSALYAA